MWCSARLAVSRQPQTVDPRRGSNGFKLSGASPYSGHSVGSAGDVNGDGFADLTVGALGEDYGVVVFKVFGLTAALGLGGQYGRMVKMQTDCGDRIR